MPEDRTPRVDRVTGWWEAEGRCPGCHKRVKRTRTIKAATYDQMNAIGQAWKPDFLHKNCLPPARVVEDMELPEGDADEQEEAGV